MLVVSGVAFSFLLLEISLRLGGFVFYQIQSFQNRNALHRAEGEYVVLCLGESTTAFGGNDAYPRQLEDILNQRSEKFRFRVVNKGMPAVTSSVIAGKVDRLLDEVNPDIVTTMIGINDKFHYLDVHPGGKHPLMRFFLNLRVVKLARLLAAHLKAGAAPPPPASNNEEILKAHRKKLGNPPTLVGLMEYGKLCWVLNEKKEAAQIFRRVVTEDPRQVTAWQYLIRWYEFQEDYERVVDAARVMARHCPEETKEALLFAKKKEAMALRYLKRYKESERVTIQILQEFGEHPLVYDMLGNLYLETQRYQEALGSFRKALDVNPKFFWAYGKIASCCYHLGIPREAEDILRQAVTINPHQPLLYNEWGQSLLKNERYAEAEAAFRAALNLSRKNYDDPAVRARVDDNDPEARDRSITRSFALTVYRGLRDSLQAQGKEGEAARVERKLTRLQGDFTEETYQSYQEIARLVRRRGLKLVAMTYPMRGLEALKNMLPEGLDIFCVDNSQPFRALVNEDNYYEYFIDRFAFDFGHGTAQGNRLIAENLAGVILRDVLGINHL